jgi:diketogulonate reductase-like aldo/keto reductase
VIATRHNATPAQVALAWVIRQDGIIAIPKAGSATHVKENRAAANLQLAPEDFALLDRVFPPPNSPQPLEML